MEELLEKIKEIISDKKNQDAVITILMNSKEPRAYAVAMILRGVVELLRAMEEEG